MLTAIFSVDGCTQNKKPQETTQDGFVLLELFTSQGCSSCPPADENLSKIINAAMNNGKNIYALAFHVDYWNRLGWKDPFSSKQYSARQAMYVNKMRLHSAYTPQMVVNGEREFVGSDAGAAEAAIHHFLNTKYKHSITLGSATTTDGFIESFPYRIEGELSGTQLYAAIVESDKITEVKKGENKGKTLKNDNVVVWLGSFDPKPSGNVLLPTEFTKDKPNTDVVIFLQDTASGKILAAQSIRL